MPMTDGQWYTGGKFYSTYYENMPASFVPVRNENNKPLEVWTGGSRSPNYRIAYTHPQHIAQAVEEVNRHNAEMQRHFNSYYNKPWA